MLHSSAYPSTFPLEDFLISPEPESINGVKSKLASVVVVGEGVGGTGTGVGEGVGGVVVGEGVGGTGTGVGAGVGGAVVGEQSPENSVTSSEP